MNKSQIINQDSGDYEYYTPKFIIEAARSVMGSIDFDPASSETANKIVMAKKFCTENGLSQRWLGNVWMNHPFSRKNNPLWVKKAVEEYVWDNARQLTCITYASTSETWFYPLLDYPQCFFKKRVNYYLPDGNQKKGATKGSVVTYMGPNKDLFNKIFSEFGKVK